MSYRIVLYGGTTAIEGTYFWWVLKSAGNGAVLATSETYTTKAKAFKTADALAQVLDVEVEDRT